VTALLRLVAVLPMIVGALALGGATRNVELGVVLAAIALVMGLAGERWELDRGRQIVTSALGGGVGYAIATLLFEEHPGYLGVWWTRIAGFFLLFAAARLLLVRAEGGRGATVVLALAGMLAVGETQGRGAYPVFVVLFLGASLAALRFGEPGRPAQAGAVAGRVVVGVAILALSAGSSAGAVLGARRLHAYLLKRAQNTQLLWRVQTGFADRMELGALDRMLDSDTIVLRVRGARVDYLRGASFDSYENGRWLRSAKRDVDLDYTPAGEPVAPGPRTTIHAVTDSVDRFFLPFAAADVRASVPAKYDAFGSLKRATKGGAVSVDFVAGPRDGVPVSAAKPADLTLSRRTRTDLTRLVELWTADAPSVPAKLDAIERHLAAEYHYARTFVRPASIDPVTDFLFDDKKGHCEYFASAMVLLARAAGIPARVVTGYRVAEHNPYGDYFVVRERNAHAWVEAWVEGEGWVTRDPTPASSLPDDQPHEASAVAAVMDVVRTSYDDVTEWLGQRTLGQTAAASAVGAGVLVWIIGRGARRRRQAPAVVPPDELALPFLAALLASLDRAGERRADSEPLERLADRVADADAAALLRRYAALRYGGAGDVDALAKDVSAYVARIRASRPSVPL
jgi:hypothetical protein